MALRKRNQMETAYGTTALTLKADEDESILVRGMYSSGASTAHMQATVGQRTVADFRVAGALGNHLCFPVGATTAGPSIEGNLLDLLCAAGIHRGFPIPSGHTMAWTGPNAAGSVNAVLYDVFDPGDIRRDAPNGPESSELDYVVYGDTGATIATAATSLYDNLVSTAEFDSFPFNADVRVARRSPSTVSAPACLHRVKTTELTISQLKSSRLFATRRLYGIKTSLVCRYGKRSALNQPIRSGPGRVCSATTPIRIGASRSCFLSRWCSKAARN